MNKEKRKKLQVGMNIRNTRSRTTKKRHNIDTQVKRKIIGLLIKNSFDTKGLIKVRKFEKSIVVPTDITFWEETRDSNRAIIRDVTNKEGTETSLNLRK